MISAETLRITYYREFPSQYNTPAPARKTHADPNMIHPAIVTLRCLSSVESRARQAGGFSRTLKLWSHAHTTKSAIAPSAQIRIGKLFLMSQEILALRSFAPCGGETDDPSLCTHKYTKECGMSTLKVGIREFRENLATYLLEANQTVAITGHGDTVGYYIPACRKRTDAERPH